MIKDIHKVNETTNYVTKWTNDIERYVSYDYEKNDYLEVDINEAKRFHTRQEAEDFCQRVMDFGYERPQIVAVEVKPAP